VARAAVLAVEGKAAPGIYELGGPDVSTFRELMGQMLDAIQRRRMIVNIPFPVARLMGFGFDMLNKISLGLIPAQITQDQVRNLARDNVVAEDAKGFSDLGLTPISLESVLPDYLWPYRPSGQYAAIKASAKNLRQH
jgi:NADH dehydrogenase